MTVLLRIEPQSNARRNAPTTGIKMVAALVKRHNQLAASYYDLTDLLSYSGRLERARIEAKRAAVYAEGRRVYLQLQAMGVKLY